jgi:hypothetical protein
MLQVKLPIPCPSTILLSLIVGLPVKFQQIPRAVTLAPPSLVILPPLDAEVRSILLIDLVVRVGEMIDIEVVKLISGP